MLPHRKGTLLIANSKSSPVSYSEVVSLPLESILCKISRRMGLIFTVDYSMCLIWTLVLTTEFSVYLTGLTDFDCGLFRSPNLETPILTTDILNLKWGARRV